MSRVGTLRKVFFFLVVLFLVFDLSVAPALAQEKIKVGVAAASASETPIYLAKKQGFYAQEGLDVDIVLVPGLLSTKALLGGSLDFSPTGNPAVTIQGAKLKMLMVINATITHLLVAQPEIKTIKELRGKRLAVSTVGALDYIWLKEILQKFDLNQDRDAVTFNIGPPPARYTAMKARTIDATTLDAPARFVAEDEGFSVLARVGDYVKAYTTTMAATEDKLARQEGQVLRFLKALVKAQRFYVAHREYAISTIMEFTRRQDQKLAARTYDLYIEAVAREGTVPNGSIPITMQRSVIERAKQMIGVTREVQPEEIFDFSYLRRAIAEVDRSGWKP